MNETQLVLDLSDDYIVAQDNALVTGKYDLSAMEQKLFLVLVSTIKKEDSEIKKTAFRIKDLSELMGVSTQLLYRDLPKICKSIMKKVVEVEKEDGSWHYFNLMPSARYIAKQGIIELQINEEAKPYLIQLKELFTSYNLKNAINLNSKYAIRIYQLTKSSLYKNELIIGLEDLKERLILTQKSYNRFCNINTKVIQPSIREINDKTDIKVECEHIKSGREVVALKFKINKSDNNKQKVVLNKNANKTISAKSNKVQPNFEGRNYDFDALEEMALGHVEYDASKLLK